jgi:hypothetical protein
MKPRTSIIHAVIGVVVLAAAWQFGLRDTRTEQSHTAAGTLVFPGLAAKLGEVVKVDIKGPRHEVVIGRHGGKWGLADRGYYPVQEDKLRELLTGLTELRITEPRTADPAEYARLGVEDLGARNGTSNLLSLLDAKGQPLATLILGHRRMRTQGNLPEAIYIRRPGEKQSWLAEGRVPADADPALWLNRDIADIASAKIAHVTATRGDSTLEFAREGDKLTLASPADHPKLDDYRVEDVGRALEVLTLTDVKPSGADPGTKLGTSVITTTDGMTITATLYKADKDIWARFAASGSGEAAKPAAALEARVHGWDYQIGAWKEQQFLPTLDDIKAAEPAKPAAPKPAGG